ncbi:Pyriculol/pyriculariol biosynthesis cluster transcription factor 1 [Psilocybe cubensis]|uniref:Pyriculol/pyriculariol biosynthesis cluster transcription factor 1 n=2 Tax=Psilocybe cubensis TaxID=181762 RepID=A0ACB8H1H6_PSICU|nr:Pyriculol/pyriculariol biosynthesis cluster transcription factor 1 [Psilocybe cubensis]KAH9481537.1 Pyriculol/pyriculariol biosynthesis cluster transcription factor 1 [Psilocybe cubensis]
MAQYDASGTYSRRGSLRIDSLSAPTDDELSNASPSSTTATNSPSSAFHSNAAGHPISVKLEEDKEPSSGPHRQRSTSISRTKGEKEKRKRSRVTPEQLVRLERYFAMDRSPTAAKRREISEALGMQERQTQIWFQNRRAKAKLQDGKDGRVDGMEIAPELAPELGSKYEVDLRDLIHEDEPVTIIPCTDLAVGNWRRIASASSKHDLVAYVSETKRCLTWFIHSDGYGFKMEIPFETVIDTQFQSASPGLALAVFVLSQPPLFYLENASAPRPDGTVARTWKRSADWTEGHQATQVLRHSLMGSAVPLSHLVRSLPANNNPSKPPLPAYRSSEPSASRPMEIPAPPLASLNNPTFSYTAPGMGKSSDFLHLDQMQKRLSYGTLEHRHMPELDLRATPHSAPTLSFAKQQPPYLPPVNRPTATGFQQPSPVFNDYQINSHQNAVMSGYPAAQAVSRPYSVQPQRFYDNSGPRALQNFHSDSDSPMLFDPQSPRLLNSPYHPANVDNRSTSTRPPSSHSQTGHSQAPSDRAIVYEIDEDLRGRRPQ